ncbi:MAG: hypothetical protein ABFD83_01300 [Armatimonadota bacterium]
MNPHELLCKTNWQLIEGKHFTDKEKNDITNRLLSAVSSKSVVERFHKAVKAPNDGRIMYPLFFIPPYNNGKKLITINGVMPKTHIFSANHYELEILRLLAIWRADDDTVKNMLVKTKERLLTTCFGKFCATGECFEASIVALRFLAGAFPEEEEWINKLTQGIRGEIDNKPKGKKRHSGTTFYYWLTLTDIDLPIAISEIKRYEPVLVHHLTRSYSYNIEYDKLYNPIAKYIVRNCLARLPEYNHIREIEGYAGGDGRFHFDFS